VVRGTRRGYNLVGRLSEESLVSAVTKDLLESFQKVLSDLRKAIDEDVFWSWDGRLQAAFVVVHTGHSRVVNDILARSFENRWDIESIQKAPPYVREAVDALVGLRERQFMYTAEPDDGGRTLYGAYWPWANGDLISIRVSFLSTENDRLSQDEQTALLNRTLESNH
jgi:hypothetical protein